MQFFFKLLKYLHNIFVTIWITQTHYSLALPSTYGLGRYQLARGKNHQLLVQCIIYQPKKKKHIYHASIVMFSFSVEIREDNVGVGYFVILSLCIKQCEWECRIIVGNTPRNWMWSTGLYNLRKMHHSQLHLLTLEARYNAI